jgi:hypothetical protein
MSIFFEIQPDSLSPIEYTHLDQWTDIDRDDSGANIIIDAWEESLNIKLNRPNFAINGVWDGLEMVCREIITHGYSVYMGSDFIEIYNPSIEDLICEVKEQTKAELNDSNLSLIDDALDCYLEKWTKEELLNQLKEDR